MRSALEKRIAQRELNHCILLPGCFDTIEDVLEAADVVIDPSMSDLSLLPLSTAQILDRPIVAIDTMARRNLLSGGAAGLLVPSDDPEAFAAAVVRLFEDADLRRRLGEAGHALAAARTTSGNSAERHLELLRRLAHDKRRHRK